MRPLQRILARCVLAWGVLILALTARAADEPPAPPAPAPVRPASIAQDAGISIFLDTPADLDAFWRRLKEPDFVLLPGGELKRLLDEARSASPRARPRAFVIESVAARGEVTRDLAELTLDFGITLEEAGPLWVPIRLDGLKSLRKASAAALELPLRAGGGDAWEVELRGKGHHAVRVELNVPVRTTVEGHRMDLAIPEAATTSIEFEVGRRVVDALAGDEQRVTVAPIAGGTRSRLSAHLSPRSRIELSWRIVADPGVPLAPLLSMQGDIAIDIDPGSFRTRSSWSISSIRGTTRTLELRLHPDDEVLEVEVDGQLLPAGIERADGTTRLTIPLTEPLRADPPTRLVMTTRRPMSSPRVSFGGFPLTHAKDQTGAVGITPSANLWIDQTAGRALRRIDPRTELPDGLRSRPNTVLAYQFFDQPFELNLGIEPSPPSVDSESRTTLRLDAGRARLDTWVVYRSGRGRLFELNLRMPRGLELESVGPDDVVESSRVTAEVGSGTAGTSAEGSHVVTVRLTERAREGGDFRLHLVGRQALDSSQPVSVALFQPAGTSSGGGRIAILTCRDVTVDRPDSAEGGSGDPFRPEANEPPSDWSWPADLSVAASPVLWLHHDGHPARIPLCVTVHPVSISHATRVDVMVAPRGTELRQESDVTVRFGTLGPIDVAVPPALDGRWELEDGDVATREDRGMSPGGDRLVRLSPAREVVDSIRLKFRLRLPTRFGSDRVTELAIPWLRVIKGRSEPLRVRVASDPGVLLKTRGRGWAGIPGEDADEAGAGEGRPPFRFIQVRAESETAPLLLEATRRAVAELPALVASRLWLKTWQGPEGDLQTRARYRVVKHESELALALPDGAEWVGAKVMGEVVGGVETLSRPGGYRVSFPPRVDSAAVIVELEYTVPARFAGSAWRPPRLLGGGLVQQTLWEVRVPWGRALVGTPSGWSDENQWYWEGYVWKRRPSRSPSALFTWADGRSARSRREAPDEDIHGPDHGYLFGRPGEPVVMRLPLVPRAVLVAVCSGTVLGLGILVLRWYPARQLMAASLLAMALAVATAVQPTITLLAAQSAVLGLILTILASLMQRMQNRRRSAPATFGAAGGLASPMIPGSSLNRWSEPGSDDSTAIRVRPASTVDHVVVVRPEASEGGLRRPSP